MRTIDHSKKAGERNRYSYIIIDPRQESICVDISRDYQYMFVKNDPNTNISSDYIFYDESQQMVCDTILQPVKEKFISGYSSLILSYGQIGAGKTTFCFKADGHIRHRGLVPRIVDYLLQMKTLSAQPTFKLHITFVEFNEIHCIDLLKGNVLETTKKAHMVEVTSVDEVSDWLKLGSKNRRYKKNFYVSSHVGSAVFSIFVTNCGHIEQWSKVKIQVVDLAWTQLEEGWETKNNNIHQLIYAMNNPKAHKNTPLNPLLLHLCDTMSSNNLINIVAHVTAENSDLVSLKGIIKITKKLTAKFDLSYHRARNDKNTLQKIQNTFTKEGISDLLTKELCTSIAREAQLRRVTIDYLKGRRSEAETLSLVNIGAMMKTFKIMYQQMNKDIHIKSSEIENMELLLNMHRLARSESIRSKNVRIQRSLLSVHHEGKVSLKTESFIEVPIQDIKHLKNDKVSRKGGKKINKIKSFIDSETQSEVEKSNTQQQTELSRDDRHNIINNLQKSYQTALLALQQTKTELCILKASIHKEVGENAASPRVTMLNTFDAHLDTLQKQIDSYDSTIAFIKLRDNHLGLNEVKHF